MQLYVAEGTGIDVESLELMYVYIDSYKVFQKIGFCLHPAYEIFEKEKTLDFLKIRISKKKNFVDLFQKERVNIKVICGKNGCGKSSLLELLEKTHHEECSYLFKDCKGRFASTRKMMISYKSSELLLNNLTYHEVRMTYACPSHRNMNVPEFSLKRNIVDFYDDVPGLFENILSKKDPLITNFSVKIATESVNEISALAASFLTDDELQTLENEPSLFYLISCLCDSSCSEFVEYLKKKGPSFLDVFLQVCLTKQPVLVKRIKKIEKEIFANEHALKERKIVNGKIEELSNLLCNLLKKIVGNQVAILYGLKHFIYLNGFALIDEKKRYVGDLSDGEFFKLKICYDLIHPVSQSERIFLLFDEPEKGLHPEWCRTFFRDFLLVYQKVLKFASKRCENFNAKKRISVIFTSHSPFLLSDLTNDYVIYLEKNKNGFSKEIRKKKNVYAGNIGEMFSTNFFMDRTIGALASERLKKMSKMLNDDCSSKELTEMKKLFACIGDDLLRRLLLNKIARKYEKN